MSKLLVDKNLKLPSKHLNTITNPFEKPDLEFMTNFENNSAT